MKNDNKKGRNYRQASLIEYGEKLEARAKQSKPSNIIQLPQRNTPKQEPDTRASIQKAIEHSRNLKW